MTAHRRILDCGERALLIELDGLSQVLAITEAVQAAAAAGVDGFGGVLDVVPAARTVLVTVDGGSTTALRAALSTAPIDDHAPAASGSSEVVEIRVRYDGPDLDEVAELTGLGRDGVIAAHTGSAWRAAFSGFAPGFAYLSGGDPRLAVPRRAEPRTSVPAGSVALAGEFSAVYPRASPGGWQLIGRTDAVLFDVDRDPPVLLPPGTPVRFVPVGG